MSGEGFGLRDDDGSSGNGHGFTSRLFVDTKLAVLTCIDRA